MMEKRTGRPPIKNPKIERLFIRVTPEEKKEILDYAHNSGFSLLELLRKGIEATKEK